MLKMISTTDTEMIHFLNRHVRDDDLEIRQYWDRLFFAKIHHRYPPSLNHIARGLIHNIREFSIKDEFSFSDVKILLIKDWDYFKSPKLEKYLNGITVITMILSELDGLNKSELPQLGETMDNVHLIVIDLVGVCDITSGTQTETKDLIAMDEYLTRVMLRQYQ